MKKQIVSLEEQETIIGFMRTDNLMEIYTCDSTMITKLDKLVANNLEQYKVIKEDGVSKTYTCPKRFLTLRAADVKRDYTEEQKKALAERLHKSRTL